MLSMTKSECISYHIISYHSKKDLLQYLHVYNTLVLVSNTATVMISNVILFHIISYIKYTCYLCKYHVQVFSFVCCLWHQREFGDASRGEANGIETRPEMERLGPFCMVHFAQSVYVSQSYSRCWIIFGLVIKQSIAAGTSKSFGKWNLSISWKDLTHWASHCFWMFPGVQVQLFPWAVLWMWNITAAVPQLKIFETVWQERICKLTPRKMLLPQAAYHLAFESKPPFFLHHIIDELTLAFSIGSLLILLLTLLLSPNLPRPHPSSHHASAVQPRDGAECPGEGVCTLHCQFSHHQASISLCSGVSVSQIYWNPFWIGHVGQSIPQCVYVIHEFWHLRTLEHTVTTAQCPSIRTWGCVLLLYRENCPGSSGRIWTEAAGWINESTAFPSNQLQTSSPKVHTTASPVSCLQQYMAHYGTIL